MNKELQTLKLTQEFSRLMDEAGISLDDLLQGLSEEREALWKEPNLCGRDTCMNINTDFIIRPLQPDDHAEWLRLREALWPSQSDQQNADEMAEILANFAQMPAIVAQRPGGGLCGFVEAAIHESARGCVTNKIGYLEGWYVDPDWRQKGVGRALVKAAEEWARAQGCTEMASDTMEDYPLSPTAHAQLGYQEVGRDIYFRKEL